MGKKVRKHEFILIIITLIAVIFTAGFAVGRSSGKKSLVIYRSASDEENAAQPPEEDPSVQELISEPIEQAEQFSRSAPNETDAVGEKLININTADAEELQSLPGIGEVIAARIIEYRTDFGSFTSIDEIMNVSGIGESKFSSIKELITV